MNQVTNVDINEEQLPTEAFQLPTPPEHGLNWWLNPDGSITQGGPSGDGALLPSGVTDTEQKGIFLEDGTVAFYEPGKPFLRALDGSFISPDRLPPNVNLGVPEPEREWYHGSEIGALQGFQ